MPHFENMDAQRGPPAVAKDLMRNIGNRDQLAWKHVELIRKRWKGKLVVKGLIAPQDARIAREFGVDGVMLSNHGGRQLDYTMSGLRTLPEIAAEAKGMTIMVDGGIRRGTDVIKALGARRPFRLDRPAVSLRRHCRRRGRRTARHQSAARRDRPRPRAARHPLRSARSRRIWCGSSRRTFQPPFRGARSARNCRFFDSPRTFRGINPQLLAKVTTCSRNASLSKSISE